MDYIKKTVESQVRYLKHSVELRAVSRRELLAEAEEMEIQLQLELTELKELEEFLRGGTND